MYNKIFTKILDSSIWLEPSSTRLVWLTMLAAMDEDGFVQFASIANLAHRARLPVDEVQSAVTCLESPDANSSDPENEGRRIERVPGGWIILNATKYRDIVTRTVSRERTRARVAKHRAVKSNSDVTPCNASVTPCNADVTPSNDHVTQSEAYTEAEAYTNTKAKAKEEGAHCEASPSPAKKEEKKKGARKPQSDEELVKELQGVLAYQHLDIPAELSKAHFWCKGKNRQCTRLFFMRWLNRAAENAKIIAPSALNGNGTKKKSRGECIGDASQEYLTLTIEQRAKWPKRDDGRDQTPDEVGHQRYLAQ